ncbi:Fatty acid desaturase [Microbulbifer sp. THAF38]|nr:Fatty acid desaturase [Microbulbifer sp. THAF38]
MLLISGVERMGTVSASNTVKRKRYWAPTLLFASTGFLALTAVPLYGLEYGYSWQQWLAFLIITGLCGISISAGNHRLWTHRTYKAHWMLRLWFALFSAATLQNTTLNWCSAHRLHHRYTDNNDLDPHSSKRGLWFSHLDWMMHEYPSGRKTYDNVKDLQRDKIVMWQHRHYLPIAIGMNFAICLILGLITGDIIAMFLLAGVLRMVVNHHAAFALNSFGHRWGKRKFKGDISARDNPIINVFAFGEGYHNYHHAFPADYRNGVGWFAYDPTKWLIKSLSWLGITWQLRAATKLQIYRATQEVEIERAEQQLEKLATQDQEYWRELLQRERQDFCEIFDRWQALMTQRRAIAPDNASGRWKLATIQTQIRELKFRLKMQSERLRLMMRQLPLSPATAG